MIYRARLRLGGYVSLSCDMIGTGMFRIEVRDNGRGILEERQKSLFEPLPADSGIPVGRRVRDWPQYYGATRQDDGRADRI